MCPRDSIKRNIEDGFIDVAFAKKIIDEAWEQGARMLKPQWYGESMLHPAYVEILTYAKKKGYKLVIFTNGSLLDEEMRKAFVDIGVDKVFVSIDASSAKEYEEIRRGLKFKIVVNNMIKYYGIKKSEMKLLVSAVELGKGNTRNMKKAFDSFTDAVIINKAVEYNKVAKAKRKVVCKHNVLGRLVVAFDGSCYLCCHDWLGEYYIGDLKTQTVSEVMNSDRRKHYTKDLSVLNICQFCDSYV